MFAQEYVLDGAVDLTPLGGTALEQWDKVFTKDEPPLTFFRSIIGQGFVVGAIVAHILLSQLAFTYLKWEYYVAVAERTAKLPESSVVSPSPVAS